MNKKNGMLLQRAFTSHNYKNNLNYFTCSSLKGTSTMLTTLTSSFMRCFTYRNFYSFLFCFALKFSLVFCSLVAFSITAVLLSTTTTTYKVKTKLKDLPCVNFSHTIAVEKRQEALFRGDMAQKLQSLSLNNNSAAADSSALSVSCFFFLVIVLNSIVPQCSDAILFGKETNGLYSHLH